LAASLALSPAACGDDAAGSGEVTLDVQFATEALRNVSKSVHAWFLLDPEGVAACPDLTGSSIGPYDLTFDRLVDLVFVISDGEETVVGEAPAGDVLVYVEAVDFSGFAHLSGCTAASIRGGEQTVTVSLAAAGVINCDDPAAIDGDACDDGLVCTVNDTCSGGQCVGGGVRDCSNVVDDCNTESCNELIGCAQVAVGDGVSCGAGGNTFCGGTSTCESGVCVTIGNPDCSGMTNQCNIGVCEEGSMSCARMPRANGTTCSDGAFCTVGDECTNGGCGGDPRDCTVGLATCRTATCNETTDACDEEIVESGACNDADPCTMGETCGVGGVCGGGVPTDADMDGVTPDACTPGMGDCDDNDPLESPNLVESIAEGNCTDGKDNDCDGNIDALDNQC
jgi:hypothetical protein